MAEVEEKKHDIDYADPENDAQTKVSGLVDVKVVSGTEGECCIYKQRVKLFRFRDEQWKERGIGNAKLLRNDAKKSIRFVMRQEKTLKPVGNFVITEKPSCELKPMANSDKALMWVCHDFSDETEGKLEKLCARFQNADAAKEFQTKFEAAQTFNIDSKAGKEVVMAETVEDIEEVAEDDIDTNKTADAEGEE